MASVKVDPKRMECSFRRYFMPQRRDWNRIGRTMQRMPLWFRLALRRLDRSLVLQFVPPDTVDSGGVPAVRMPSGVWYICQRLRGTRWLAKRAVFVLMDAQGNPCPPSADVLKLLRRALAERRRGRAGALEREFTQSLQQIAQEREREGRERVMVAIANVMRRMNMSSYMQPRVFLPAAKG